MLQLRAHQAGDLATALFMTLQDVGRGWIGQEVGIKDIGEFLDAFDQGVMEPLQDTPVGILDAEELIECLIDTTLVVVARFGSGEDVVGFVGHSGSGAWPVYC